jgi:OOP family OmpA-OmpF porin
MKLNNKFHISFTMLKPWLLMMLFVLCVLNAGIVRADENRGWYLGGAIGKTEYDLDNRNITEKIATDQFTINSIGSDKSDKGYKLFAGFQFNSHFSLEAGYFNLGETDFTALVTPEGSLYGKSEFKGFNLDLIGSIPFTEKLSGFGLVGVTYAQRKDNFIPSEAIFVADGTREDKNTNPKIGLGLQYSFTPSWAGRLAVERYRLNDAIDEKGYANSFNLGLVYKFGRTAAPAIAPSPIPPPITRQQEYCTTLDIEFEIDNAAIQRAEKEKLAIVANFLNKYPATTAVIEGHTDDVGDTDRNLKLSQRRAESVVDYLVANYNIARNRLTATGYGESQPIADNSTEEGKRHNRRIKAVISCANDIAGLQPLTARVTMALRMEYARNKADVAEEYYAELNRVAKFLKDNPDVTAIVEGHTDNTSPGTAFKISQERAQKVVDYLVEKAGVDRSRLTAEGFGLSRRYAYNSSEEGRQQNRRVNIIINYPNLN